MRIKNKGLHALLLDKGCLLLLCVIAIAYLLWSVNSSHGFRYMVFYVVLITRLPMSLKGRIITAIITMLTIAGGIFLLLKTDHPEYIDLLLTIPVIALLLFLMLFFCKELFLYPIDLICGLKQASVISPDNPILHMVLYFCENGAATQFDSTRTKENYWN